MAVCRLLGKKPASSQAAPPLPPAGLGAVNGRVDAGPPPGWNGILAGHVLDTYNHSPIDATYIQVSESGDAGNTAAPIEGRTHNRCYCQTPRFEPRAPYHV